MFLFKHISKLDFPMMSSDFRVNECIKTVACLFIAVQKRLHTPMKSDMSFWTHFKGASMDLIQHAACLFKLSAGEIKIVPTTDMPTCATAYKSHICFPAEADSLAYHVVFNLADH